MLDNPNEGFSHFDRIGPAIVTIAQVQGYLAHEKRHTFLAPPYGPRQRPTVESKVEPTRSKVGEVPPS